MRNLNKVLKISCENDICDENALKTEKISFQTVMRKIIYIKIKIWIFYIYIGYIGNVSNTKISKNLP